MGRRTKIHCLINSLMVVGIISYLLISHLNERKIVSFNMKDTINSFLEQVSKNNLDDEKITEITKKFNRSLDYAITSYANDNNVLILVNQAVVKGSDDVTDKIQYLIAENMSQ